MTPTIDADRLPRSLIDIAEIGSAKEMCLTSNGRHIYNFEERSWEDRGAVTLSVIGDFGSHFYEFGKQEVLMPSGQVLSLVLVAAVSPQFSPQASIPSSGTTKSYLSSAMIGSERWR
jgi:hypothetical protein